MCAAQSGKNQDNQPFTIHNGPNERRRQLALLIIRPLKRTLLPINTWAYTLCAPYIETLSATQRPADEVAVTERNKG